MTFIPELSPPAGHTASDLWFIFRGGRLLTKIEHERYGIPQSADLGRRHLRAARKQYLGRLNDRLCYAAELDGADPAPDDFEFVDLRALFGCLDEELVWIAGRANQLVHWNRTHLFCGGCGRPTQDKTDERAKICPRCGLVNYPRLSPAVIVAVVKQGRILLARNQRFRGPFYSVLAGFVEPGETLEACVEREIREEVGIFVQNIRYFGSQPWPFPDSLMIGFTAEHAAGEIAVDHSEIIEAAWYAKDNLPRVPPQISIARHLIDWFAAQ